MKNYFANNIKYIRKESNLSQKEFASILNIARSTLSCWENGTRIPNIETILKISKKFNINQDIITTNLKVPIKSNTYDQIIKTIEIENDVKITIQKKGPLTEETINIITNLLKEEIDD